jgi:hypothetical protein
MLWTIAIVLGLLWALGMANSASVGGYVHVLLVVAIILFGYGVIRRQRERRGAS